MGGANNVKMQVWNSVKMLLESVFGLDRS